MVGGTVVEVIVLADKVWINCQEVVEGRRLNTYCAIYVAKTARSRTVSEGDTVWWQGSNAYWTPRDSAGKIIGNKFDIVLERLGYSGVSRPQV